MTRKPFSVIIVNWNAGTLLADCIRSVYRQTRTPGFEVIVVDNASSDESVALAEKEFGGLAVIRNRENIGFGAANNAGVRQATGEVIILLNPDTRVTSGALDRLYGYLKNAGPSVGAVGPLLTDEDGTPQRDQGHLFPGLASAFFQYSFLSHFLGLPGIFMNRPPHMPKPVDWLCGACLACTKERYEALGGFDERYFLYAEDMDLCYRMKQKDWQVILYPAAAIIHLSKQSVRKQGPAVRALQVDSLKEFYKAHHHPVSYFFFRHILFCGLFVRLVIYRLTYRIRPSAALGEAIALLRPLVRRVYA